jgi:hypothetical protein
MVVSHTYRFMLHNPIRKRSLNAQGITTIEGQLLMLCFSLFFFSYTYIYIWEKSKLLKSKCKANERNKEMTENKKQRKAKHEQLSLPKRPHPKSYAMNAYLKRTKSRSKAKKG